MTGKPLDSLESMGSQTLSYGKKPGMLSDICVLKMLYPGFVWVITMKFYFKPNRLVVIRGASQEWRISETVWSTAVLQTWVSRVIRTHGTIKEMEAKTSRFVLIEQHVQIIF